MIEVFGHRTLLLVIFRDRLPWATPFTSPSLALSLSCLRWVATSIGVDNLRPTWVVHKLISYMHSLRNVDCVLLILCGCSLPPVRTLNSLVSVLPINSIGTVPHHQFAGRWLHLIISSHRSIVAAHHKLMLHTHVWVGGGRGWLRGVRPIGLLTHIVLTVAVSIVVHMRRN